MRAFTAVFDGAVEVGARHDDERIAAAQLEHRLLDAARPARAATLAAGGSLPVSVTAATRGSSMTRATRSTSMSRRLKRALGKAGAPEDVLDRQRALRHVRGVLEQRRRCPPSAPARRSGRPARTESSTASPRARRRAAGSGRSSRAALGGDRLVGEQALARARRSKRQPQAHFSASSRPAFASLPISMRHHAAERVRFRFEDLGRPQHHLGARGNGRASKATERASARRSLSSICASVSSSNVRTVSAVAGLMVAIATNTLDFSKAHRYCAGFPGVRPRVRPIAALQERAALGAGAVADGARAEHFAGPQGLVQRGVRDHLLEGPVDRAGIACRTRPRR